MHKTTVGTLAVLLALGVGCDRMGPQSFSAALPSSLKMASTADLKDKRIGVVEGSAYDIFATKTYPGATILQFDSGADLRQAVLSQKVDAGMGDAEPLAEVLRTNDQLALLGEPVLTLPLGVGFRKGNTELRDGFNRFLAQIKQNGVHADMVSRWLVTRQTQMPAVAAVNPSSALVVGVSGGGLPFGAVKDGELVGFDVEMVTRFAASRGQGVTFSMMAFGGLIAANASGKVDLIAASMFITEERKQRIDFSDSYYDTTGRAYALKSNIVDAAQMAGPAPRPLLTSVDDLKDKRIAVQLGTVYDIYAIKTFPDATVLQLPTFGEVTLAVSAGKADAGLSDVDTLAEVMRSNPDLVPFGPSLFVSPVAAGFTKKSTDLRLTFNAFLAGLQEDGTYADMVDRWMTKRNTNMPPLSSPGGNGVLTIGISAGGFPFSAVQNNELAGFDVELGRRFAAHLGREARFANQEFSGLIAALVSGKVDVIIADMYVTEERQKQIDFSDRYFEQDNVVFTRRANTIAQDATPTAPSTTPSFFARVVSSFQSNIIQEQRYLLLWDGLKATVLISVLATLFGTALGSLVCFMRMSPLAVLRFPAQCYIAVLRGMPIVVLLMLLFYVVFGSVNINAVLVAVIAFAMHFAAYVSEMFRSGIEGVDRGQSEAGIAMGFTRTQTFRFIVLPQMIQRILPVYKGEFISLVKMTSIVGYIAVQDLTKASDIIRSRTFDAFFPLIMVAVLYFLISWVLMQGLEYLERATDPKYRRQKAVAR